MGFYSLYLERLAFNHKVVGLNLSLPDERSNRKTSCRIGFYSVYLVSFWPTMISLDVFVYIHLHRRPIFHYISNVQVLQYMARVERVLSAPGGNLLLAGRAGVGRRTAIAVCAHKHRMSVFTPKVSRSYGLKQFRNDLKTVMQQAGLEGEQVCFIGCFVITYQRSMRFSTSLVLGRCKQYYYYSYEKMQHLNIKNFRLSENYCAMKGRY